MIDGGGRATQPIRGEQLMWNLITTYLLWIKVGAVVLAVAVTFGAGWKVCSWKHADQYRVALEQHVAMLNEQWRDAVAKEAARLDALKKRELVVNTVIKEVVRRVKVNSDYCGLRAADVRLFDGIRTTLGVPPIPIALDSGDGIRAPRSNS